MTEAVLKIDASEAVSQLKEGIAYIEGYQLESAISTTVDLVKGATGALADRLVSHLDNLLAEQLRQVSAHPLPVIE